MRKWIEGQINHIEFPLVDATDFATPESALTVANIKIKIFGTLNGNSAAASLVSSGTGSLTKDIDVVRSGIYHIALTTGNLSDTQQAFFDNYIFWASCTGAAIQIIPVSGVRMDSSDLKSAIAALSDAVSNVYSAVAVGNSRVLLNQSRISDIQSFLLVMSDALSDAHSDLKSYLVGMSDMLSNVQSAVALGHSDLKSFLLLMSDALSDAHSDLASKIAGVTATVSASAMSNIASKVWAEKYTAAGNNGASSFGSLARLDASRISDMQSYLALMSDALSDAHSDLKSYLIGMSGMLSDTHSAATAGASRALLNQSRISDVQSFLLLMSDALSDAHSDLASKIAGITATVSSAAISDIASAVHAGLSDVLSNIYSAAVQGASRALLNQSRISDVQSFLSDFMSDFQSRVPAEVATASQVASVFWTTAEASNLISQIDFIKSQASNITSYLVAMSDVLSNAYSAAAVGASRALLNQSRISDINSLLLTLPSDVASKVWAEKYTAASNVKASSFGSALRLNMSRISDIQSYLVAMSGALSDVDSALSSQFVYMSNALSDAHSDIKSQIGALTVTLTASDLSDIVSAVVAGIGFTKSDIASAVWGEKYTAAGNVGASTFGSLARLNLSRISDIQSFLSDAHSDLKSYLVAISGAISDTQSALSDAHSDLGSKIGVGNSRVLLNQSRISDINSLLLTLPSDVASKVWVEKYTDASNVKASSFGSLARLNMSRVSDIQSYLVALSGLISDVDSALSSQFVYMSNAISDAHSDLGSKIGGIVVTLTASDISDLVSGVVAGIGFGKSDLASAVWAEKYTAANNNTASSFGSLTRLNASRVSDLQSFLSDAHSDLASKIGALNVGVTSAAISDIASAVHAGLSDTLSNIMSAAAQAASRALATQNAVSDLHSDFQSRVPKLVATASQLSDLHSDLKSQITVQSDTLSDIMIAISDMHSDVGSKLSSIQSDLDNIQTRLPATFMRVQKNTALANFTFPMILSSDHVTGATGKTVTAQRSLDGAAFASCANAVTEISAGVYKITLAAADLNADTVMLKFTAADCDATLIEIITEA